MVLRAAAVAVATGAAAVEAVGGVRATQSRRRNLSSRTQIRRRARSTSSQAGPSNHSFADCTSAGMAVVVGTWAVAEGASTVLIR